MEVDVPSRSKHIRKRKISSDESEYLMSTDLFAACPDEGKSQLLSCLAPMAVRAGERFIHQGDEADCMYLIQKGSCTVNTEVDGVTTAVARRQTGDIVGEMALLTGENRTAHVDADTDMVLWCISRTEFDEMCLLFPAIREFVTELVTKRISPSKFAPHRTVGKYVITDVLDEGGWGIVYKGVHESLNMQVAIKMLKHAMAMDSGFLTKFQDEAKVIARLHHSNIVRVYDIEHLYRTVFIVMEYLTGSTLANIVEAEPRLPFPRVLNLLVQVAQGLEYAHARGIVHQDVKPANVFVEPSDRAKIIDFGLATPPGGEDQLELTGTPFYMAPEQIRGGQIDERTDVYALGITAFEISTGQKPFPGPDLRDVLRSHKEVPVPDPRSLNADLPVELNNLIQKATQKDPAMRHQTMGDVLADLKPIAEKYRVARTAERIAGNERMVLHMSYDGVDRGELARLVEEFCERLKKLGVELTVTDS